MNKTEKDYWILWNQLYEQVGPIRFKQLLAAFGSAERAWKVPSREFEKLGWPSPALKALGMRKSTVIEPILDELSKQSIEVITISEDIYPENLRTIPTPPPLLYIRGVLSPADNLSLAVVGTRKMTRYGQEVVEALIPELCAAGLTIVSGLALGVDVAAQRATLEAGGRTIAVLAGGVAQITPRSNERLGKEILARGGAVISEFPPRTEIFKSLFPFRNRIISGMSLGTLVVEAAAGSGTFHTVRAALEQGREVFAVPGSVFSPFSVGTAKLIQSGAKPVTSAKDILEELEVETKTAIQEARGVIPTTKKETELLALLGDEERHIDEIIKTSNISTNEVLATLTLLEMKGLVKSSGPSIYRKVS